MQIQSNMSSFLKTDRCFDV